MSEEGSPVCDAAPFNATCGPCAVAGEGHGLPGDGAPSFLPYEAFDGTAWQCPVGSLDSCAAAAAAAAAESDDGADTAPATEAVGTNAPLPHHASRWPWQAGGRWRIRVPPGQI